MKKCSSSFRVLQRVLKSNFKGSIEIKFNYQKKFHFLKLQIEAIFGQSAIFISYTRKENVAI